MLGTVRSGIFFKRGAASFQRLREFCIEGNGHYGCLPRALAHDAKRAAHSSVVWTKDNAALRHLDPREDGSSDVTRIHVAGMGGYASHGSNWKLIYGRPLRQVGVGLGA